MGVTVTGDVTTVEVSGDTTVTVTENVTNVSVSDSTATLTVQPSQTSVAVSGNTTSINVEAESQEVVVNDSTYLGNIGTQTLDGSLSITGHLTHGGDLNDTSSIKHTDFTSAGFMRTDGSGNYTVDDNTYLTSFTEQNDLSASVTWADVPDDNITETSVTQHQSALSIEESQISDLQSYLTSYTETDPVFSAHASSGITSTQISQWDTAYGWGDHTGAGYLTSETSHDDVLVDGDFATAGFMKTDGAGNYSIDNSTYLTSFTETNDLSTSVTWANVPNDNITESSVTQHQTAINSGVSITESQISDFGAYLTTHQDISGKADLSGATFTGDVNLGDNNKINIGASSDLQIYHDGSDSYIDDQGTGDLILKGLSHITMQRADTGVNMFRARPNRVQVYADGNIITTTDGDGLSVTGELSTSSNISTSGNIVVGGTVDGRDVSTDGSKLDTLLYHRVSELRLAGNTSAASYLYLSTSDQNLGQFNNIYHPSTPEDTVRLVDVEWTTYWGYTSAQNDTRLTLQLFVPAGATTQNLGTVTEVSSYNPNYFSRGSGQKWYYVSGDVTQYFTPFGRMSQTTSGSLKHTIVSSQYDPNYNRTYFCLRISTAYLSTGDTAYWHPYAWESTYTILTKSYDITERYRSGLDRNKVSFKLPFTDTALTFRLKIKELASGDNAQVADSVVRLTSMGV